MFRYEILEILVIDLYKNGIKVSSNIVGDHKKKSMITSNLPENWRVEEENTMTLRHQAANLMSCNDEHNLETPKTAIKLYITSISLVEIYFGSNAILSIKTSFSHPRH